MATSVTQGLSDEQAGGASYRIARRITLSDSTVVKVKLGPAGEGRVLDISETGMAAQAHMPIQPGSKITVDFDIPDGGHIRTEAQVVWRTVDKRMGLRFLRMSEPTRLKLGAWIGALAGSAPPAEVAVPAPVVNAEPAPRDKNEFWHLITEIKTSKLYLDSALALVVERAAELTGATGAALAIGPPENMICRATLGDAPDVGTVINPDSRLTSECIRTRNTVHVVDTDTDARVDPFVCRDLNMRSAVLAPAFPNKGDKNFTVVLEMFSSRARNFSPEQIRKLEQLAEVAGVLALDETSRGDATGTSNAGNSGTEQKDTLLFAQDELDHLVERFVSDLKIGTPAAPQIPAPELRVTAVQTKPADVKKPPVSETSFSPRTPDFAAVPPKPVYESKPAPKAETVLPVKKEEPAKPVSNASDEMELVSLAEPLGSSYAPKHDNLERTSFTLSHQEPSSGSNAPMIAVVVLVLMAIVGAGIYFLHNSSKAEKAAASTSAPVVAPETNTSITVTPESEAKETASAPENSKKTAEAKPVESKQEKETKKTEAPAETQAPEPIVLASGKHVSNEAPLSAPAIPMGMGAAPPPAALPMSPAKPQLAVAQSTGVIPGELIHRVSPRYPSAARSSALSGEVVLKGRITKDGNVEQLKAVSGNPILAIAAIDAVRQWKYKPYRVDGKPIDMDTTFRIQFALPK